MSTPYIDTDTRIARLELDIETLEMELAQARTLMATYIDAYDRAVDPQAVGSACRLIEAEAAMRDYLEDFK